MERRGFMKTLAGFSAGALSAEVLSELESVEPTVLRDLGEGDVVVFKTQKFISDVALCHLREEWSKAWDGNPPKTILLEDGMDIEVLRRKR